MTAARRELARLRLERPVGEEAEPAMARWKLFGEFETDAMRLRAWRWSIAVSASASSLASHGASTACAERERDKDE